MPYYVVHAGWGRSSTHIMKSNVGPWFGGDTLCSLQATRHVNVYTPSEASCRECRKRWELAVAAEAATARKRQQREQWLTLERKLVRNVFGWTMFAAGSVLLLIAIIVLTVR